MRKDTIHGKIAVNSRWGHKTMIPLSDFKKKLEECEKLGSNFISYEKSDDPSWPTSEIQFIQRETEEEALEREIKEKEAELAELKKKRK